ncbi:MAG TPA: C39 family peptidase, partial [Pelolinea sp.]|nr:C39 family peptidase [Pelolinea sp.]
LSGVYGSPQLYTLDCEAQAAVDFARLFGVNIGELEFINRIPKSDDPEEGFVGDINGPMGQLPPGDYGVHAKPVAKLLREYGVQAKAVRDWEMDQIRAEIASGNPVIVWIVNLPFDIDTEEYTAPNGNTSKVARYEHTWIVTGYNMSTFTVIDSVWTYNVKISTFKERWEALGNQAIVYRGE